MLMTDGLVSDTDVLQHREITPSMSKRGKIAPVKSDCADEAATRDSIETVDDGDRWQDSQMRNLRNVGYWDKIVRIV